MAGHRLQDSRLDRARLVGKPTGCGHGLFGGATAQVVGGRGQESADSQGEVRPGGGGRSHHEQSARSSAPFDDPRQTWPWAISDPPKSQVVSGCQVGLRERWGSGLLLAKEWRVESTSEELLIVLAPYICQGGHDHGSCLGKRRLQLTGRYTPMFAQLVLQALRPETS